MQKARKETAEAAKAKAKAAKTEEEEAPHMSDSAGNFHDKLP